MLSDISVGDSGAAPRVNSIRPYVPSSNANSAGKQYTAKLCFLLDVTGSMHPQRDAIIEKIFNIVDGCHDAFPSVALKVGAVGYRDVDMAPNRRLEILPFTSDVEEFHSKLTTWETTGGDDEAEDVLGGMDAALTQMDWEGARIRVLFHIGDSPHHGSIFHDTDLGRNCGDKHPHLESSPRPYNEIMEEFADKKIDYTFTMVSNPWGEVTTRKMCRLFADSYDSCQTKRNFFGQEDITSFSPDKLFTKVVGALTGSISSFIRRSR